MDLIHKTFKDVTHIELRKRGHELIYFLITKNKKDAAIGWGKIITEIHNNNYFLKIHSDLSNGKALIQITNGFGFRSDFNYTINQPSDLVYNKENENFIFIALANDESFPHSLGLEIKIIFNPELDASIELK